jgi:hypothetical protein
MPVKDYRCRLPGLETAVVDDACKFKFGAGWQGVLRQEIGQIITDFHELCGAGG